MTRTRLHACNIYSNMIDRTKSLRVNRRQRVSMEADVSRFKVRRWTSFLRQYSW